MNQSRLHALEELAEARAKIIDLEERISAKEDAESMMTMEVAKEAAEKMKDTVSLEEEKIVDFFLLLFPLLLHLFRCSDRRKNSN